MPGLVAFKRRWSVGSDDFVFPGCIEFVIRTVWLVTIATVYGRQKAGFTCSYGYLLHAYCIAMLTVLSIHLVLTVAMIVVSMRGTLVNAIPRRHLPIILYCKLFMLLPEFAVTLLGTLWAFDLESNCDKTVVYAMRATALSGWLVLACLLIGIAVVFDPLGSPKHQQGNIMMEGNESTAQRLWTLRCKVLCCCVTQDEHGTNAFSDIAQLITYFFKSNCDKTVVYAMRATALSGWLVLACLLIGIAVVFDPLGSPKHQQGNIMMEGNESTAQRLWTLRCKVLCCCVTQDEHGTNAFSDIAQLITYFFKGLDVVVSDVAAGLILVQLEQQKKLLRLHVTPFGNELQHRLQPQRNQRQAEEVSASIDHLADDLVFPSPQTWMTLPLAAHYMRFAAASYGWALYMYTHLCSGAPQLYPACRCCASIRGSTYTMDDNCCNCNTAAIIKTTGIKEQDIVYATYYNRIYQIPFFVALDHVEKAVVVSIRGTLSLRDAVTDLCADSELLETAAVTEGRAHKGILHAAKYIQQIIIELQLLNKAFEKAPGYQLVITGHSLGAGAASLLAILLRPEYPQLKCFAFSPPGWLVSLPVSRYTEQFICSVVVGVDLVPRLGFLTMENLKSQIIHAIRTANQPKYQILLSGVWNFFKMLCGTSTSQQPSPSQSTDRTSLIQKHSPQTYTDEHVRENEAEGHQDASNHCTLHVETPLYMPGHVLYIEETAPASGCCGIPLYRSAWARVEVFDEIVVSPKMIHDHLPDVVSKALNQLSNDTSVPEHYAYNLANETAVI